MLSHALLDDVSDVLERWCKLLEFVVTECDVVSNVTLVAGAVKGLLELSFGFLVLFFLIENAALCNDSFSRVRWHLSDKRLCMCHFFELILNMGLKLQDLVSIFGVFDLLCNIGSLQVHTCLKQALCVVKFVLGNIWEELRELVIHVSSATVILDVEVAVCQKRKGGTVSRTEL